MKLYEKYLVSEAIDFKAIVRKLKSSMNSVGKGMKWFYKLMADKSVQSDELRMLYREEAQEIERLGRELEQKFDSLRAKELETRKYDLERSEWS